MQTDLDNQICMMVSSVCSGFISDTEECTPGVNRRQLPIGGVNSDLRIRAQSQVGSERSRVSGGGGAMIDTLWPSD